MIRTARPSSALLTAVVVLGLAAAAAASWLAATSELEDDPAVAAVLAALVGGSLVASGLVAWHERPGNRLGPLMVVIGFAWFALYLADSTDPLAFTVGTAVEDVYLIGFVFLLLSLPRGRLSGRADHVLFGAAIAVAGVLELVWLTFADSHAVICDDCPANRLEIWRNDELAQGLLDAQRVIGASLSALTIVILVRRWQRATGPQRQAVAPVLWVGSAFFAALLVSIVADILGEPLGRAPDGPAPAPSPPCRWPC